MAGRAEKFRVAAVVVLTLGLTSCATLEEPVAVVAPPAAPPVAAQAPAQPTRDPAAEAEEARALIAQAETDIQRARAKRALWSKAWEALVLARQASAKDDPAGAVRWAKQASELAALGLEQLAYPAVK